jgi:hypothetical protein
MGFYAAAVAFSSIGLTTATTPWEVSAGVEFSYLPRLSRAERSAGFDKPESSNLSPVIPRPRISVTVPGAVRVEMSWLPPVRVFGAKANLSSLALSRTVSAGYGITVTPRFTATGGRVRGPITCNDDLLEGTESEALYFRAVCGNRESDDHFEPDQVSGELIVGRQAGSSRLTPYVGVGIRRDDVRFDIGVLSDTGRRNPEHPVLAMRATRPFVVGGTLFDDGRGRRIGAELYYAPGSLLTARVRGELRVWKGR